VVLGTGIANIVRQPGELKGVILIWIPSYKNNSYAPVTRATTEPNTIATTWASSERHIRRKER